MPSIYRHLSNKQKKNFVPAFHYPITQHTHMHARTRIHTHKEKARNNRDTERALEHTGASGHRAVTCCASTFPGFARHRLESCPSPLTVKAKGGFQLKEKKRIESLTVTVSNFLLLSLKTKQSSLQDWSSESSSDETSKISHVIICEWQVHTN